MAISTLEQNTVTQGLRTAKLVIEKLAPVLNELNVIYDAGGGVKETLTQPELDSVAAFGGITKAQLDDGMFALTSTLKNDITNAYAQLTQLAARGDVTI